MAFVTVLDTNGRPVLVHTSIFDKVILRPRGDWSKVWKRWDSRK